jgi:hypothetical protein
MLAGAGVLAIVVLASAQSHGAGGRGGQSPSLRYSGQYDFQPRSRLLPSEQRGVQMQAGLLPSEQRDVRASRGGAARPVTGSGTVRYSTQAAAHSRVAQGYRAAPSLRYQNAQLQPAMTAGPSQGYGRRPKSGRRPAPGSSVRYGAAGR